MLKIYIFLRKEKSPQESKHIQHIQRNGSGNLDYIFGYSASKEFPAIFFKPTKPSWINKEIFNDHTHCETGFIYGYDFGLPKDHDSWWDTAAKEHTMMS